MGYDRMCRLRGKGRGGWGGEIVCAPSYASSQFLSRTLDVSRTFLCRFDTTLKLQNLSARCEKRRKENSVSFLHNLYIFSRNFSTYYRATIICTQMTHYNIVFDRILKIRLYDLSSFYTVLLYTAHGFLHFCSTQASVVVTISLRSEFCTAHREGKRGCPRASLSMAFSYEGGGWIRTPKGEMAHSDALIQRRP